MSDIGWVSALLAFLMLLALVPIRVMPEMMIYRLSAFVASVLVVYLAESEGVWRFSADPWFRVYLLGIGVCMGLWLRFEGRAEFRINALDILVVALVVTIPNLSMFRDAGVGLMFVETLLLFYGCELVLSGQPARWGVFRISVFATLGILAARGILA